MDTPGALLQDRNAVSLCESLSGGLPLGTFYYNFASVNQLSVNTTSPTSRVY